MNIAVKSERGSNPGPWGLGVVGSISARMIRLVTCLSLLGVGVVRLPIGLE